MDNLVNLLQGNSNEALDKFAKLEARLDDQEAQIKQLRYENCQLHHIVYSLIKTRQSEVEDFVEGDVSSEPIEKLISSPNSTLARFGVSAMNSIISSRNPSKVLQPISPDALLDFSMKYQKDEEKVEMFNVISKTSHLENSVELCDVIMKEVGECSETLENIALDAFSRMERVYDNVELVRRVCECAIQVPCDDVQKKLRVSYLVLRYAQMKKYEINSTIIKTGVFEYVCDDYVDLKKCGVLGIFLLAMEMVFTDETAIDEVQFNLTKALIQSPLWHEDLLGEKWQETNKFNPFHLMRELCSSMIQRSMIFKMDLEEDIFEAIDVDNIEAIKILILLGKVCANETVNYIRAVKDAMADHLDDTEYQRIASQFIFSAVVGNAACFSK
ncbi:hypothetical protein EIN_407310 [Entamoeba invadens IP1]|uniref:Uncharacterized protein n=1 Tax=Entamoeba invadens IP1 TaxID=370355 RepID=A0A0A1TWI2_ENTIV|nr:hypothetical protein EIN_407310 [Entamoeba invadens IP1]ELP85552.1 hypothetical protein EIN_407310 [Entamoeba invadens IP1]|eukprot:XP_004184898.1 hypothetical protein EIN_407310 [Entamoeba invadens IP1]